MAKRGSNFDGGIRVDSGARLAKQFLGSKTHDFASIADGAVGSTTVTVTGAALGDFAEACLGVELPVGAVICAQVKQADTVNVTIFNKTGGALDLASTTLSVVVRRYAAS